MISFRNAIVFSIFLVIFIPSYSLGCSATIEGESTKLTCLWKEKSVIKVLVVTDDCTCDIRCVGKISWGNDDLKLKPNKIVKHIAVTVGDENLYIPLSAYADLSDPYKIYIQLNDDSFSILIYGGDAGSSYRANLLFVNRKILKRKVYSTGFPDDAFEETIYKFNESDY